jgi:hypothetical protein
MPRPGVANNPDGVNSWSGWGDEEPYGQATKDASLARAAPMAGAAVAAGPIAAPKRDSRKAQRGTHAPQPAAAVAQPAQPQPEELPYDARLAQWWQGIASIPGASDLVKTYAQVATQRLVGG